jgi:hypothetical protein
MKSADSKIVIGCFDKLKQYWFDELIYDDVDCDNFYTLFPPEIISGLN